MDKPFERVQVLIHPMSYRDNIESDAEALKYFLWRKTHSLMDYNINQNRVLSSNPTAVSFNSIIDYFSTREKNSS